MVKCTNFSESFNVSVVVNEQWNDQYSAPLAGHVQRRYAVLQQPFLPPSFIHCVWKRIRRFLAVIQANITEGSCNQQEALLLQRDRATHLSVEILQLQNISLENPIVWHYLGDSTFSRFDTIPECERHTHRQTDRHMTTAYTALSIASCGINRPYCTTHQL